ncbi:MAG TPA: PQQ-dependent sugar dehydrogenase [Acidobacteriota bacterium]
MRFTILLILGFVILTFACPHAGAQTNVTITLVAPNIVRPVAIGNAGDGTGRLFFVQQGGQILVYDGTQVLGTPFLDVSGLISSGGERGLLGLAFHPNYSSNGYFFVFYTAAADGALTVVRYKVSSGDPNVADPNSAFPIISVPHPSFANHNGGMLAFGSDGMLYISTGDGGSAGDPDDNAQNINILLGKILRLNVDIAPPFIPNDNPFVGVPGADEIWAYGLRNPWRFSFDRSTGDLYIGDVGQGCYEEANVQPANSNGGENYGWDELEGFKCYDESGGGSNCNLPPTCNTSGKTMPFLAYAHSDNPAYQAITGGYLYRGLQSPPLAGKYIYADYGSGDIWAATKSGGNWTIEHLVDTPYLISTFGEDENGEIYFAHNSDVDGAIYKISAGPTLPYSDDFEDNDASDWTVVKGNWSVVNGNLQGTTSKKAEITSPFSGCGLCNVHTDVQVITPGGRVSVLGWYQNKKSGVELLVFEDRNKIVLKQRLNGFIVAKAKSLQNIDPGVDYHVDITFDGTTFQVFWDNGGTAAISLTSQTSSVGTVGFRVKSTTKTSTTGSFREILVD